MDATATGVAPLLGITDYNPLIINNLLKTEAGYELAFR
jgi:hypothetical protein